MTERPSSPEARADTVSDHSERELIARIQQHLPAAPDWMLVGIGDDAAVVEPERNRVEVLTIDAVVEGVHFDRAFVPPDAIGYRALAVNLSDLAAMGASPRLALLSMALPASLPLADFDAIVRGFAALAAMHRVHVAGGNLTRSPGPLMIDVTLVGTVKPRQALTRSGARPGDDLYVSGTVGAAGAGLRMLAERGRESFSLGATSAFGGRESFSKMTPDPQVRSAAPAKTTPDPVFDAACVARYLRPEPRVRLGVLLSRNRAASACVDLSDGLSDGLQRISEASGVGMIVDGDALPIDLATRAYFAAQGLDPVSEALAAGDDYELLVAVRPRARRRLSAALRHGGVPLTRIGTCTADRAMVLQRAASETRTEMPAGFSHFR